MPMKSSRFALAVERPRLALSTAACAIALALAAQSSSPAALTAQSPPSVAAQAQRLPRVAAGSGHGVVVLPSGAVKVFSHHNKSGELGQGHTKEMFADEPLDLPDITDAVDASAGGEFTLVLRANGTVLAWGDNRGGQAGQGAKAGLQRWEQLPDVSRPSRVGNLEHVRQLSAGTGHSLALLEDGTVRAWGGNGKGKLGIGTEAGADAGYRVPMPTPVKDLANVKAVSAGWEHSLAVLEDGTVWAWGGNGFGQIGDEVISNSWVPRRVPGIDKAIAVVAEGRRSLALRADGTVWVWGDGGFEGTDFGGAKGPSIHTDGSTPWTAKPMQVPSLRGVTAIAAGAAAMALLSDGTLRAWGYNAYGAMGTGVFAEYPRGLQTPKVTNVVSVSTGFNRTYFVRSDGMVLATGSQRYNVEFDLFTPTPIMRPDGTWLLKKIERK
jgi:alpha-tubulin suppressor-like RCC1 family protein